MAHSISHLFPLLLLIMTNFVLADVPFDADWRFMKGDAAGAGRGVR
ncbi:MAG: hypothetical protein QM754_04315 [Tepidisphaeraceae bacterium]